MFMYIVYLYIIERNACLHIVKSSGISVMYVLVLQFSVVLDSEKKKGIPFASKTRRLVIL